MHFKLTRHAYDILFLPPTSCLGNVYLFLEKRAKIEMLRLQPFVNNTTFMILSYKLMWKPDRSHSFEVQTPSIVIKDRTGHRTSMMLGSMVHPSNQLNHRFKTVQIELSFLKKHKLQHGVVVCFSTLNPQPRLEPLSHPFLHEIYTGFLENRAVRTV